MVLVGTAMIETVPLRWLDVDDPVPEGREVRVRVSACALCRTDLHVIEGELPQRKMPVIPGHQVVGVVDALGAQCTCLHPGQRVGIAWLRHTCGQCRFCANGRENLCEEQRFTGYHADGGYAQYALVDERFAYEMPPQFADVQAATLLCSGIVGYRALKRANLPQGGKLAIYGFGSSAHLIAQIALSRGCELYVVTRGNGHQQLARQMGAKWAGERADDMPVKVDSAIVFAPAGHLVPPALENLEKGGTLSLADIYMTPIPSIDYQKHIFYERDIHTVTANTRQDGRDFLAEAAAINIQPRTAIYRLDEANRALLDLKRDRINGTAVLLVDSFASR